MISLQTGVVQKVYFHMLSSTQIYVSTMKTMFEMYLKFRVAVYAGKSSSKTTNV